MPKLQKYTELLGEDIDVNDVDILSMTLQIRSSSGPETFRGYVERGLLKFHNVSKEDFPLYL